MAEKQETKLRCTMCNRKIYSKTIDGLIHVDGTQVSETDLWCPACYIMFEVWKLKEYHNIEIDKEDLDAVLHGRKHISDVVKRYLS